MAVYVDDAVWPWRGKLWAHLMADSIPELHAFADGLGLQRRWFQSKRGGAAHYDITSAKRLLALRMGAVALCRPEDSAKIKAVIQTARAQLRDMDIQPSLYLKV